MFCSEKRLIGIIKDSWKTEGLTVGCTGEEYLLAGGQWILRTRMDVLTNKVKAVLVELTGQLPEQDEWITYRKDMEPQMQVPDVFGEIVVPNGAGKIERKNVIFTSVREVVCRVWSGKRCVAVPESFSFLVDPSQVDEQKETNVDGPYNSGCNLWWQNNAAVLRISCATTEAEDEELLEALEKVL